MKNIPKAVTNIPKSDRESQPRRKARGNDRASNCDLEGEEKSGREGRRKKKKNGTTCVKARPVSVK